MYFGFGSQMPCKDRALRGEIQTATELNLQHLHAADCSLLKNMAEAHKLVEECFTFPKSRGSRTMRRCFEIDRLSH